MNIPFLDFMHPVEEDVFYNIFLLLYVCLLCVCSAVFALLYTSHWAIQFLPTCISF